MPTLFDTHCHIQVIGQDNDGHTNAMWDKSGFKLNEVIQNAKKDSVKYLMVVGCDLQESQQAIELAKLSKDIYASIGIHPHEADRYATQTKELEDFVALASDPEVKAIGECGLDYYYSHSSVSNQKKLLKMQLSLATEKNLPLIFHVRDAYKDFWPIFNGSKVKGVLHSYTDSIKNLEIALSHGLYIGVNGIATFTKDPAQLEMYKAIPLYNLVLETDAPYLTPAPIRGNINEPKNVVLVAKFLASLKGISFDELAQATTANARKLFSI